MTVTSKSAWRLFDIAPRIILKTIDPPTRSDTFALAYSFALAFWSIAMDRLELARRRPIFLLSRGGNATSRAAMSRGSTSEPYGLEIDPYYVDTAIRRFKAVYGIDAFLADGGSTFEQVSSERAAVRVPADG